jgi:TctA family transporter
MEIFSNLALGLSVAATFTNIFYCFLGCLLGTLIGVLPGIGPLATIAMLLPITYKMTDPVTALIMLAGIYYGAQYGGSTTAILVNLPGETSSVVTTLDGYQMARRGRAGPALATAAIGSFFAGTVATLLIAAFAPPLAEVAFKFGPAEYFSLMVLGLIAAVVLAHGSIIKALAMVVLGLLVGMVGTDVNSGVARFSFDVPELTDGIEFAAVAMGMFGFGEIIANLEQKENREVFTHSVGKLMPSKEDFRRMVLPILRGTTLGSFLGILPGGGAVLSAFSAYAIEKKISKYPEQFGKGAIEGVAGPEAANNAGAQTSFIPMLTLGIPTNAVMALMVAGMMIHNIQPGPQVMTSNPNLFWGLIASMWIGNLMLLVLNLPLVGLWVKLLKIPPPWLYAGIIVISTAGVYGAGNSVFNVGLLFVFGLVGFVMRRFDFPAAPLIVGLILAPMAEQSMRQALTISQGDWFTFFTRPLSGGLMAISVLLLVLPSLLRVYRQRRDAATGLG